MRKYGEDPSAMAAKLGIAEETWKKTLRGWYMPEKVLLYKLGLLLALRKEDMDAFYVLMHLSFSPFSYNDNV